MLRLDPFDRREGDGSSPSLLVPSIPAGFSSLCINVHGRSTGTGINSEVRLVLGDVPTPGAYSHQALTGLNLTAGAQASIGALPHILAGWVPAAGSAADLFSMLEIAVSGYAGLTGKPVLARSSGVVGLVVGGAIVSLIGGNWQSPLPVSCLSLVLASGNWAPGSYAEVWLR